jgi:hypothetical protein
MAGIKGAGIFGQDAPVQPLGLGQLAAVMQRRCLAV